MLFENQLCHFFAEDFGVRAVREAWEPDELRVECRLSFLIDPVFESRPVGVCAGPEMKTVKTTDLMVEGGGVGCSLGTIAI